MSLWGDLKQKAIDANPELAAKAAQAMNKAKDLAVEAGQKAAPVLKEASQKAAAYAQEKTPIVKAQALKAIEDAKVRRAELQVRARNDKAAREEMIRTMYDISLTPDDDLFIDEPFNHYERQFNFFVVTGEVLDSQKRNQMHLQASHSHSSGGGYISHGSGYVGGGSSSSYVSSQNVSEHEFWVQLPNGKEACFQLNDNNVRIREGQTISMVFMHPADTADGKMVALYNHSAEQNCIIRSPAQINSLFNIYTVEPGFFNKNEVLTTRSRLLQELERRLAQLATYAARQGKPVALIQAIEDDSQG